MPLVPALVERRRRMQSILKARGVTANKLATLLYPEAVLDKRLCSNHRQLVATQLRRSDLRLANQMAKYFKVDYGWLANGYREVSPQAKMEMDKLRARIETSGRDFETNFRNSGGNAKDLPIRPGTGLTGVDLRTVHEGNQRAMFLAMWEATAFVNKISVEEAIHDRKYSMELSYGESGILWHLVLSEIDRMKKDTPRRRAVLGLMRRLQKLDGQAEIVQQALLVMEELDLHEKLWNNSAPGCGPRVDEKRDGSGPGG